MRIFCSIIKRVVYYFKTMLSVKIPKKPKSLLPIKKTDVKIKSSDYVWNQLTSQMATAVAELIGEKLDNNNVKIEEPPVNISGDLAFAAFPYAKQFKKSPNDIALDLASKLNKIKDGFPFISKIYQSGGYINIDMNIDIFGRAVIEQVEQ